MKGFFSWFKSENKISKLNKNYVENFFSANDSLGVSHKIRFTGRKKPFQIVDKIKLKSTNIEEDKKSDKKSFESIEYFGVFEKKNNLVTKLEELSFKTIEEIIPILNSS